MDEHARRLGEYIRHTRKVRHMSIRALAGQAGIDSGGLARLECGKVCSPLPNTLRSLALALDIPLADLFAVAGYVTPQDLPEIGAYLRAKYRCLSEETVTAIAREVERLAVQREADSTSASLPIA